ncbi:RNHCP domain-containing protein [Nocardiopsis sp. NPDC060348]|uniref:RNHCP domain-containing protein n=1 Tax=unclassified Nocardiopsis TaxID=2649073 RepID=UPI0036519DA1
MGRISTGFRPGGRRVPISIAVLRGGAWMLVHRCVRCGEPGSNRVAGDDSARALVRVAVRPLPAVSGSVARRALIEL